MDWIETFSISSVRQMEDIGIAGIVSNCRN